MSQFNIGDVVRIGKGKVEYVVSNIVNEPNDLGTYAVEVESMNTGKAQVIEAGRLTLLRAAETEPMNVPLSAPESVEEVKVEGEDFDPRTDRRQSAYGLSILAALVRKNPRAGLVNVNPLKPIGSGRRKVRAKVKARRTATRVGNEQYNALFKAYNAA